jgi:hypothetical protein
MSDRHVRFRGAPGAQLPRLGLLGVFEVIVGLHEKKPGTLPIADRVRLLQAGLRLPSPQIDASHEPTPVARMRVIAAPNRGKCQNVSRGGENFRAQPGLPSVGYATQIC